jgi:hypothetical protein
MSKIKDTIIEESEKRTKILLEEPMDLDKSLLDNLMQAVEDLKNPMSMLGKSND